MYLGETRVNLPIKLSMMDTVTKGDKMILRKILLLLCVVPLKFSLFDYLFKHRLKDASFIVNDFPKLSKLQISESIWNHSTKVHISWLITSLKISCIKIASIAKILSNHLTVHEAPYFNYNSSNSQDSKCLSVSSILSNFHSLIHQRSAQYTLQISL